MPYLHREDVIIYYEDVGAGPPLLLIHGDWSCSQEILAVHAGWAERRRLIAPDRRGYGRSTHLASQPEDPYGVHAEDMAVLLERLGIPQVDVLGFSGGGIVALRLALARPEMARSLVLECTHYSADMPPPARDWFRRLVEDPESLPPATVQSLITCHGEDYWRELLRVFAESCLRIFFRGGDLYDGRLSEVTCPTLILHGSRDPFITDAHALALAEQIPHAQLHIFSEGRHGLFDRSGQAIAAECRRLVEAFWQSLGAGGPSPS